MAVRFLVSCLAVLACGASLGTAAAADNAEFDLQLEYRVSWSNADIASATANWSFGDTSFELAATSRTLGMTETFRKYRGKVEISGRIEDGRHAPDTLYLSGISKKRTREATTSWDGATGAISTTRTPELDLEKVFPLQDRHIEGAIDPLSAMLNALANLSRTGRCSGTERVYDGLRTSEITLHDLGTAVWKRTGLSALRARRVSAVSPAHRPADTSASPDGATRNANPKICGSSLPRFGLTCSFR